jgi:hypothetical protein
VVTNGSSNAGGVNGGGGGGDAEAEAEAETIIFCR